MTTLGSILLLLAYSMQAQSALPDALAAGRFAQALEIAGSLLKTQPNDPRLLTARGLALAGLGRHKDAVASFDRALQVAPNFMPALKAAAQTCYTRHDARAASYLARLLRLDPGDQTAHGMAGALAFEAGDCALAVKHFQSAKGECERNELASSQFGQCLIKLGRPGEAASVFRNLIANNPATGNGRYNLAVAQLLDSKPAEAIETLQPITAGDPADAAALNLLASAQAANHNLDEALASLRRAAVLAPLEDVNYLDLAILYFQHDRFQTALEILGAGLRNVPRSARLLMMRGAVHAQLAQFDKASDDFQNADRIEPDRGYGSVGLSVLLNETNQLTEARTVLRERLKGAPSDAMLNYLLADSLLREGAGFEEAEKALLRSVKSKPNFASAHAALGKLYSKSARIDEAIAELRLALKYNPAEKSALNQLFLLLMRTGREQEAQAIGARLGDQLSSPALRLPSADRR